MLLHRDGSRILHTDGNAYDFRGAKDCCNSETGEPNPKWPLGSDERNAWLKLKGNVNDVSRRPGPWRGVAGGEDEFQSIGGGYAEFEGRADLTKWNPAFWDYNDKLTIHDASRGQWVEVGVIDGWGLKGNCHAGDIPNYHPWASANNIQGESHCGATALDTVQENWVRKVVSVFGRHGNVTWEISNESSLVPGWNVAWEDQISVVIRDEERKNGYPQHLIASNAQRFVSSADWNAWHTDGASVAPSADGKITSVSEYNPHNPLAGDTMFQTYCDARNRGVYYWYWRHGMSLPEWVTALGLMKGGCGGLPSCLHPNFEDPGFVVVQATPAHLGELGTAESIVKAQNPLLFNGDCLRAGGSPPGDNPAHAAERWNEFDSVVAKVVVEMKKQGICAWQQRRVEMHSLRPDGLWTEIHMLATGNGCFLPLGNSYKNTWKAP